MKKIFSVIILILVTAGCTGVSQKDYLDDQGSYVKERYLAYDENRVRVREERPLLNPFLKDEILPYIEEDQAGESRIGMEIKRHNTGGKTSLKLMTIIADEDEYTYYLLFERSRLVKKESGEIVEEFDIEVDERVLEVLSTARDLKVKFTDYSGEKHTVVVGRNRKISYRLIYEEYTKRKGA